MSALQALLAGLAGAGRAGTAYYGQKRETERATAERDEERRRQQEQQDRMYQLSVDAANAAKTDRERDYAKEAWAMASPNEDLTTNPLLPDMKRFGFGLKDTPATPAPILKDSFTLPSMPGSGPSPALGGAPSTPMTGGKYDPTAEETPEDAPTGGIPKPLPMGGPIEVGVPTYGLGAPGKVTRAETRQEAQQRVQREAMLTTFKATLADPRAKDPAVRAMIEGQIRQLEQGADPTMSESELVTSLRLGNQPAAGADKDLIDPRVRGELAAALKADPSMIPERWSQLPPGVHDAYAAWEKRNRGTNPQGGGGNGLGELRIYDRTVDAGNKFEAVVKDARTALSQAAVAKSAYDQLKKQIASGAAQGPSTQALIMSFGKVLDPGSVVRETEYNRSQDMQGLIDRFDAMKQKLLEGGVLSPAVVDEMYATIQAVTESYQSTVRDYALRAKAQVEKLGGDLSTAFTPSTLAMLKGWEAGQGGDATPSSKVKVQAPDGTTKEYDLTTAQRLVAANPDLKIIGGR